MNSTVFEKYCGSKEEEVVFLSEEGNEITDIAAKAFLSCKSIKKLTIGGSVTRIGDWAFAHMKNLQILLLPRIEITFGKKVFLDCEKLMQIQICPDESGNPGTPYFLASAVSVLKKEELCQPVKAADKVLHQAWIQAYDKVLFSFLEQADEDGFDPVFFGWFRVEDIDEQLPRFLEEKRRKKAQLVLQRLLYPAYLKEENREKLYQYIKKHVPSEDGKKEHTAVYALFCDENEEYGKDIKYLQILKQSGCLNSMLMQMLLENIKEASAEIRAYLLREKQQLLKENDYFAGFDFGKE